MTDYYPPPSALKPGSRVWAYLRDAGGPDQTNSVIWQETEIRDYCQQHSLVLIEVFADKAKSGRGVALRNGFNHMIKMSENKDERPVGLLLWDFARFSRDFELGIYYKALLQKRGIIIHSLTDPAVDDELAGKIIEMMIDFSNQEKRRQISHDVKRGIQATISDGFSIGTPPRGYKTVKIAVENSRNGQTKTLSKWEPDSDLWDLIILVWKMRSEGRSYREIHNATRGRIYKNINSWSSFFRNRAYLGYGICSDLEIPNHHKAAIGWDIWQMVQRLSVTKPRKDNPNCPGSNNKEIL